MYVFYPASVNCFCAKMQCDSYTVADYTSISGPAVRTVCRQSIPSSNIDNCAALSDTLPLCACGQMKRPRSKRLAKAQPVPSHHKNLEQIAASPAKGEDMTAERICSPARLHQRAQAVKPLRMSVMPAASQMRVPARSSITGARLSSTARITAGSAAPSMLRNARPETRS